MLQCWLQNWNGVEQTEKSGNMSEKFTPYALTAIPGQSSQRDPNGIYFIRTPTGMKIYAISADVNRTPVELEVTGYVDTSTSQTIQGTKTFKKPVTLFTADGFEIASSNELKLSLVKYPNGSAGLLAMHNDKSFLLDMKDLNLTGTSLKVVPLSDASAGEYKNELGWKRIYTFNSAVTLASGSNYNVNVASNLNGWDSSENLHLKSYGNWDITWLVGSVYRSFKSEYNWDGGALKASELAISNLGIFIRGGNKGRTITIPAGAKFIFW